MSYIVALNIMYVWVDFTRWPDKNSNIIHLEVKSE